MTHDECGSWQIVVADGGRKHELNHHLLNTWCMELNDRILGNSELALRIHTLIAHAAYLLAGMLVLCRLDSRWAKLAGFALLNLNLFMLDFFFLARGYGLAMALQLWSMLFLLAAVRGRSGCGVRERLGWSLVLGALAVVANFAFLNYFLPLCAVALSILIWAEGTRALVGRKGVTVMITAAVAACFLGSVLYRLFDLRSRGQMNWGRTSDFVELVVGGLVRTWMYESNLHPQLVATGVWIVVGLATGSVALSGWRVVSTRKLGALEWVVMIGAGSVVLTIVQRLVLGTPLPTERQALYFIPTFALVVAIALDAVRTIARPRWLSLAGASLALMIVAAMGSRFAMSFRAHSTLTWRYDSSTLEALQLIDSDRRHHFPDEIIDVGHDWHFEPSITYYRTVGSMTWMNEPIRSPLVHGKHHYIYVKYWQSLELPSGMYSMVKHFEDTGTALLRAAPSTLRDGGQP